MMNSGSLRERIAWLMDKESQQERPKQDRYRWQLSKGLNLHMLRAGHLFVLAIWRWNQEPSDQEVKTVAKTITSYERPSPSFVMSLPTKLEFKTEGKVKVAKYVAFTFEQVELHHEQPKHFEQPALLELPPEETTVRPNNYEAEQ